jgi:hypothetical protein
MVFVDEAAESVAAFDLAGGRRTGPRGAKKSVRPGNQQFRAPGFNLRTPQVLAGQSGFASRSFFDRSSSACKTGFSAPSWNRTDSKLSNGAS